MNFLFPELKVAMYPCRNLTAAPSPSKVVKWSGCFLSLWSHLQTSCWLCSLFVSLNSLLYWAFMLAVTSNFTANKFSWDQSLCPVWLFEAPWTLRHRFYTDTCSWGDLAITALMRLETRPSTSGEQTEPITAPLTQREPSNCRKGEWGSSPCVAVYRQATMWTGCSFQ